MLKLKKTKMEEEQGKEIWWLLVELMDLVGQELKQKMGCMEVKFFQRQDLQEMNKVYHHLNPMIPTKYWDMEILKVIKVSSYTT